MKRSSMLSRAFFRRPAVRDLVPDLKLVLAVIAVGCESHMGTYRPGGLAEDSGLDLAALAGALDDLEHRGHIARDRVTGEIFLVSFFRDNSFKNPQRRAQARDDFWHVESGALRAKILQAIANNPDCDLSESDLLKNQQLTGKGQGQGEVKKEEKSAGAAGAAPHSFFQSSQPQKPQKHKERRRSGILTWLIEDVAKAEAIEAAHAPEAIAEAIQALGRMGKQPLPNLVAAELAEQGQVFHLQSAVQPQSPENRVASLMNNFGLSEAEAQEIVEQSCLEK